MLSQTIRPNANGSYLELINGGGGKQYERVNDQSLSTDLYNETNTWKKSTFGLANPTRQGAISKVTVHCYAGHGTGTGYASGKTVLYNGSSLQYGSEVGFGSSGYTNYDISTEYLLNPWTGNPWAWEEVDSLQAGGSMYGAVGGYCCLREVWVVVESSVAAGQVRFIGMMM